MNEKLARAIQLIEQGQHEEGLKKVEKLEKEANDETKRTISELYYELGLVDKALSLVEPLMFAYPDHGELFAFAAECYSELGKEDEAIDMLTEIKSSDAAYVQAQLLLADLYEHQGLSEVAEQKLLEAIKNEPDNAVLQFGLGEFYLNRGEYRQSITYYKKAIYQGEMPDDLPVNPKLKLAEAYSATGEFEDAVANYKEGLEDDETPDGLFGYGFTSLQIDDYETAISVFNRLIEMDPDYTTVYTYLAKAYIAQQKLDEALQVLEEGIKKDEFNEDLYLELAKLQFSRGNDQKAVEFLEKVIALNPSNISAVKELLLYFDEEEDYEALIELLEFLDNYSEFDPLFERYRGKALFEENDIKGAVKAYDIALESLSKDEVLLEEAATVYLAAGNKTRAVTLLEDFLMLQPHRFDIEERLIELKK
ncbi:tetratricopeptide repeat protein [Salipaludibacillus agaradhaerens]|uniref:Tetratricopeptide repeat protein n=1 Tax=Salipaludibacillus agaradhaerens TaxID=76935 RepID=A0A9Q4B189_SALAG|nr:tetratricopeptide repeat protein [Salipaludibacillus agaradhaerens]MCR6096503.1 tetratricopeptide repeat protein [Salipaludibacillus agaradhaerens]MCR6113938.1 tetratricopeptide repeat protein [Salipaludibacillus agaradhaerens]